MRRFALFALAAGYAMHALAAGPGPEPALSAASIVEKNVASRGGLEAWRKIQTMVWIGHIETRPGSSLPYILEMKRPNKTRFEIQAQGQLSVRIYDGTQGWKLLPARDGRPEVQAYTAEELRFARDGQGFDGPLIDHQAKGIEVALEGVEEIEGRPAYRLGVTLPSGSRRHVWVDTQSFLDIKYDRESRNAVGMPGAVSVFNRDYRAIDGLQLPFLIESITGSGLAANKMVIDRIVLNPSLDERTFSRPDVPQGRSFTGIGTRLQTARPGSTLMPGRKGANLDAVSSYGQGQ